MKKRNSKVLWLIILTGIVLFFAILFAIKVFGSVSYVHPRPATWGQALGIDTSGSGDIVYLNSLTIPFGILKQGTDINIAVAGSTATFNSTGTGLDSAEVMTIIRDTTYIDSALTAQVMRDSIGALGVATADSMGVDEDGDKIIDRYLYSTAGAAFVLWEGNNLVFGGTGDTLSISAVDTSATLADDVDTSGTQINAALNDRISIGGDALDSVFNLTNKVAGDTDFVYFSIYGTNSKAVFRDTLQQVEFAIIDSAGNKDVCLSPEADSWIMQYLGLGLNNPTYPLDVYGSKIDDVAGFVFNDGDSTVYWGLGVQAGADDGLGTNLIVACKDGDGTYHGSVAIVDANLELVQASDSIRKENIDDSPSVSDKLDSLRVVDFNYKGHPRLTRHKGFIAQEVMRHIPQAIIYDEHEDLYCILPLTFIPYLVKGHQEQQVIIESLIVRIEALEAEP